MTEAHKKAPAEQGQGEGESSSTDSTTGRQLVKQVVEPTAAQMAEPGLNCICLANVKPRLIRWLWKDRIALGKALEIAGDAGVGKGVLTADVIAGLRVLVLRLPIGRTTLSANTRFKAVRL